MLERVSEYIKENNLIEDGDRIVVGVSGGADSVCLLHALWELYQGGPVELLAVHINHGIRGRAADEDEEFVREFAKELGVRFFSFRYDVPAIARDEGMSEEEAGREIRYRTFLTVCNTYRCNKVAIAHNKNDNAETMLFHLFRGSGIRGLTGIGPIRTMDSEEEKVLVVRPLLFALRAEIEAYLTARKLEYRTDASNLEEGYSRNKLRNRILKLAAEDINANVIEHIAEAAEELREAESFIAAQIRDKFKELARYRAEDGIPGYELEVLEFGKEDIVLKKGILLHILEELAGSRKDIGRIHIMQLLELLKKQVGKQLILPYGIVAKRTYGTVRVYRSLGNRSGPANNSDASSPVMVTIPGRTVSDAIILDTGIIPYEKGLTFPKNSCIKWFDYDKIVNAVEFRTRKEGDYIQINSAGGRKKLKDYFIDIKLPKEERDKRFLVADGSHIMWILGDGDRMSEKYKITDETRRILWIHIIDAEEKDNGR